MSDLFGNYIVGFPTRRLIYQCFKCLNIVSNLTYSRLQKGQRLYRVSVPSVRYNHRKLRGYVLNRDTKTSDFRICEYKNAIQLCKGDKVKNEQNAYQYFNKMRLFS